MATIDTPPNLPAMNEGRIELPPEAHRVDGAPSGDDLSGRDRMTWNILGGWISHMAVIVVGFVLPRLVDRRIGPEALGIWDFGWSMLAYFGLAGFGIIGSISRHVARSVALRDTELLCAVSSTGMLIYSWTGTLVVILTIGATYLAPTIFGAQLGDGTADAQWVICLLGASVAVQFYSAVFTAVLTGTHRWLWYNGIASGVHLAVGGGMIVAVILGYGVRAMAGVTLVGEVTAGVLRAVIAYRGCPGLRLSPWHAKWSIALNMFGHGGKSMLYVVASVFMRETTRLLVLGYLGLTMLAIYSRSLALVTKTQAFGAKFAHVFAPTASAYQASGSISKLRDLMITSGRYALYCFLPMIIVLAISGGYVLRLWMGARYESSVLLTVLALGHLPVLYQLATMEIIRGMNRHGWPSLVFLGLAGSGIPLAIVMVGYLEWGMIGGGLAATAPLTLLYGVFVPIYGCRVVGVPIREYIMKTLPGPVLAATPLAACLVTSRLLWPESVSANLLGGLGVGMILLAIVYWRGVFSESQRDAIRRRLGGLGGWCRGMRVGRARMAERPTVEDSDGR